MALKHNYSWDVDICTGCGAAKTAVEDGVVPIDCPNNDHVAYFKARQQMNAELEAILGAGYQQRETRH